MTGINRLCEFLMVLMIISCAIGWIVIGIGILKCWKDGKCPKSRICKNSGCQWGTWCKKHIRYNNKTEYLAEILRETKKLSQKETRNKRLDKWSEFVE